MAAPIIALIVMAAVKALGAGAQAKQQAQAEKFRLEQQELNNRYAAKTSKLNAGIEANAIVAQQQAIEMQGIVQAMQDGAVMAAEAANQASSGVYLNSASKHEIRSSQFLSHQINMNNLETNRIDALTSGRTRVAQHLASAYGYEGAAEAASIIASSIDPDEAFGMGLLMSAVDSGMQYYAMSGYGGGSSGAGGSAGTGASNGGMAY